MYKRFFKRVLDFVIALIALALVGWFLVIVAIWLHFANKGAGAFFLQERPGKGEKIFRVIKFKTMTDERDAEGNLLPDEVRLTKVGRGRCWSSICLYTMRNNAAGMRSGQESADGRSAMEGTRSAGPTSSSMMSGMSTIALCGLTYR